MPAIACEKCGKKDFSVNPTASGLCKSCLRERGDVSVKAKPKDEDE